MQFRITYTIGKGNKERFLELEAASESEASKLFFLNPPATNDCILREIQIIEDEQAQRKKVDRKYLMKIKTSFDQFLLDRMEAVEVDNNDLINAINTNRNSWLRLRNDPGNFTAKQIIALAQALEVTGDIILDEIQNALSQLEQSK